MRRRRVEDETIGIYRRVQEYWALILEVEYECFKLEALLLSRIRSIALMMIETKPLRYLYTRESDVELELSNYVKLRGHADLSTRL